MLCLQHLPVVSLQPFQVPGRPSLSTPGLFLLALDIPLHLFPAPVTDSHDTVGRVPKMTSPELLLHLRMQLEKTPCNAALHDLHHVGDKELRLCVDQHMYMVRHDLHGQDPEAVLLRNLLKEFFAVIIRSPCQDLPPVLCTPDDMILKVIYITPTIR